MTFLDSIINLDSDAITSYSIDGQTWYKVVEIGDALGYIKARKALNKLMSAHEEEFAESVLKTKIPKVSVNPATGQQYTARRETLLINKEGIIKILMYSNLPLAAEFRRAAAKELAN